MMIKKLILLVLSMMLYMSCESQIPIEQYKEEIENLDSPEKIQDYWNHLYHIDQNVLLKSKTTVEYDSISICNMVRTALMFEIHGDEVHLQNNQVPILNLIHNYNGEANLTFWPIIEKCVKKGGEIETMGGGYPAYELEGISMSFYNYSLFKKDSIYDELIAKLKKETDSKVSLELLGVYNRIKEKQKLNPQKVIGKWFVQPFKNLKEDYPFEFVKMTDGILYVRTNERNQKLILVDSIETSRYYQVENEPFGWKYELKDDGHLRLIDHHGNQLIAYSKWK